MDRFVEVMTDPESERWARFIVREQMDPTEAFDTIFATMGVVAHRIVALVEALAEGRCDATEVRLRVLAIIGQALVFRTARSSLLRLTGWWEIHADGVAAIQRVVRAHTLAIVHCSFREADQ
ncbi:DUF1956 domain-containing protein [Pedomonas mirosovicensis]|uniref:DUF1956 domain-containing protein n=1 Tax=Pedomonas mirosovicensis TaxID=2908641 RepID=UPI002167A964|nr:DUF1956 domain-containing protein [Pedomonas mirosovicensis]MCH8686679.1 DUF1956 domain-containing protein [Pedomonas mirosovicensis]